MQKTGSLLGLAEYARQHPDAFTEPYKPVSLPPLRRTQCPHRLVSERRVSDKMTSLVEVPCRGQVVLYGWCAFHAIAHTFLEIGSMIRYPELALGWSGARICGAGLVQWEAYAETTPPKHLEEDCARLKVRYDL